MIEKYLMLAKHAFSKKTWQRVVIAFSLIIVPVVAFTELAEEVGERETLAFDETFLLAVNSFEAPYLDTAAVVLTQLGGVIGVSLLVMIFASIFWTHKRRARSVFLVVGVGGAGLLNVILKSLFQRDRPELWERLVTENSYSFPSGHAMASSALALSLMVVFWRTRYRWLVICLASIYMIVIAFTRLYLGVHYPTDIVAGWIVSAMWIAAVTTAIYYSKVFKRRKKSKTN